jgi:hypothetical protein
VSALAGCSDDGPPPLQRGSLSCSAAEAVGARREFEYHLARFYDRSLLATVTCGIDGDRSASAALFPPPVADRAISDPDAVSVRCEVAGADSVHEFRFRLNLPGRTIEVQDNSVEWAAPVTCTEEGDLD